MKHTNFRLKKGQVLIIGLIFMGIILIFSSIIFSKVGNFINFGANNINRDLAKHTAEAGLDATLRAFNTSANQQSYLGEPTTSLGTIGQFWSSVTPDPPGRITIKATGFIPNSTNYKAKQTVQIQAFPALPNTQDQLNFQINGKAVITNGFLYAFGQSLLSSCGANNAQFGSIDPITHNINQNSWTNTTKIPGVEGYTFEDGAIALTSSDTNGYIYIIGAGNSSCNGNRKVYYTQPHPVTGQISGWTETTEVPIPAGGSTRCHMGGFVNNGYIYLIGGAIDHCGNNRNQYATDILRTRIDPLNGNLGSWDSLPTNLGAVEEPMIAISENKLYIVGCCDEVRIGNDLLSKIKVATINTDTTISSFQNNPLYPNFPIEVSNSVSVVSNGYVYTMGGRQSVINDQGNYGAVWINDVYVGKIESDHLEQFTKSPNSLPLPSEIGGASVKDGYIYYIGGWWTESDWDGAYSEPNHTDLGNCWITTSYTNGTIDPWFDCDGGTIGYTWFADKNTYEIK